MRTAPPAPYIAFAGFGLFWGTWGAALPGLRDVAGLTDAQLGSALLCVGLGALPAMAFTGKAVDRFGVRIAGVPLIALALAGVLIASSARGALSMSIAMLLIGATSGASDVAANALAGHAERQSGQRVITRAHAVFSSFVVVGSLGAGLVQAVSNSVTAMFTLTGLLIATAGSAVLRTGEGGRHVSLSRTHDEASKLLTLLPFITIGLVGGLGFAAENAHQSWGAIFLTDELHIRPGLAAVAPATFAAFAAVTRFTVGASTRIPDRILLTAGAAVAFTGTLLLAHATNLAMALVGLALAAIGTSVLFPTLLSLATRDIADHYRGRATSAVGTTAYLGFLLGPFYVGVLSGALGLRGAMVGVAVLAALFAVLAPLSTRKLRRLNSDIPHEPSAPRSI